MHGENMKQASLLILVLLLLGNLSAKEIEGNNSNQKLKLSFSERFRLVTWDNAITLDDSANGVFSFTRHRTSISAQWYPIKNFETTMKLTNEFRYYFAPEDRDFDFNEIFIDQFYVKWKDPFNIKGTLTLGRQNIILGKGFVVMDGGPLVGSRCIYFNAARFDWRIKKDKELTLFYLYQPELDDIFPIINDQKANLIEQPEEGFGIYFKTIRKDIAFDAYFIRKNIKKTDNFPSKSNRNTIGLRLKNDTQTNIPFCYKVESAYQFGKLNNDDISAFGGYFEIKRKFNWNPKYLPKNISAGLIYLSGDNPKTDKHEGWDPLFSRWPKWSESYIYTQIKESKVAYWSNIVTLFGRVNFTPSMDIKLSFDYLHLMATKAPVHINNFISGDGKTRGNLIIGKIDLRINKYLTGHLLWESFIPGNFYFSEANNYNWTRFELMYKI